MKKRNLSVCILAKGLQKQIPWIGSLLLHFCLLGLFFFPWHHSTQSVIVEPTAINANLVVDNPLPQHQKATLLPQQNKKIATEKSSVKPSVIQKKVTTSDKKIDQSIKQTKPYTDQLIQEKNQEIAQLLKKHERLLKKNEQQYQALQKHIQLTNKKTLGSSEKADTQLNQLISYYSEKLINQISAQWTLPPNIPANLKATVSFSISYSGELLAIKLIKSSGNTLYDHSIIQAVQLAAPFSFIGQLKFAVYSKNFKDYKVTFSPKK